MKRVITLILAMMLCITPVYGSAASSESSNAEIPVTRIRYSFEHSMLPRYFYDDPDNMLSVIDDIGLYTLWESVSTENGADPTYPEAEYIPHWFIAEDGTSILQMELPNPDAGTLCYRIYFIYNDSTGEAAYFTVECDDFAPELSFICTWTPDMTHTEYGTMYVLDKTDSNYEEALLEEAKAIMDLANVSGDLTPVDSYVTGSGSDEGSNDGSDTGSDTGTEDNDSGAGYSGISAGTIGKYILSTGEAE